MSRICLVLVCVIPLVVITLALLGGTITIAVIGIVVATKGNHCPSEDDLVPSAAATNSNLTLLGLSPVAIFENSSDYVFWLAGSTGCGVLFVIVGTLCLWCAANIVYYISPVRSRSEGLVESGITNPSLEFETLPTTTDESMPPSTTDESMPPSEYILSSVPLQLEALPVPEIQQKALDLIRGGERELFVDNTSIGVKLRPFQRGPLAGLFLCSLFGMTSILCFLWSFAIAYNKNQCEERTVVPFVLANFLSGIVAPVSFFICAFLLINLTDYYTNHKVKAHTILPLLLNSLEYEAGEKRNYWVLASSFILVLPKRKKTGNNFDDEYIHQCCPLYSTIILAAIVSLSIMLSFSYFIDVTLVNQVSVTSCSDSVIDSDYSCFRSTTLGYVNCTDNDEIQILHCFKFYRFGIDVDLITSLTSAFAFFLLTNRIFSGIFYGLKLFRHVLKRKVGTLFIVSGILLLLMNAVLSFVWFAGHTSASVPLFSHLDVLNLAQLVMVSLFVLLVGLLARNGIWVEEKVNRKKAVMLKPIQKDHDV